MKKRPSFEEAYAELVRPYPELAKISAADRDDYVWCYRNREALLKWWSTLPEGLRTQLNHPAQIRRRYLAYLAER
jgi:hypothetical protein